MPLLLATEEVFPEGRIFPLPNQTTAWLLYIMWVVIKYLESKYSWTMFLKWFWSHVPSKIHHSVSAELNWTSNTSKIFVDIFGRLSILCLKYTFFFSFFFLFISKWTDKTSRLIRPILLWIEDKTHLKLTVYFSPSIPFSLKMDSE